MDMTALRATAQAMVAPGRGILAADESSGTIEKRFSSIGVASTEESRRLYRDLLFTTEGAEEFISGVILFDETIRQQTADGVPFPEALDRKGIVPGIKVDKGANTLAGSPDEKITEGLDGLRDRLVEYRDLGARFAKWRAVIAIGQGIPSRNCIAANAQALARYAALCQEEGLVPIVEPEVLMDGDHDIQRCYQVTHLTLRHVFWDLAEAGVAFDGMILKPNMVIPGKGSLNQSSPEQIAEMTLGCFAEVVPAAVPGVVFLSGGQSEVEATRNLNALNLQGTPPWELSFSYGRALQQSALQAWAGKTENRAAAQAAYLHRAKMNGAARRGHYREEMEREAA